DAITAVGGFDDDTLTEDFDLTVKILKLGSPTRAVESICLTEAPETLRDLYRQRLRWDRGHVQTLLKHRDVFRTPRYGFLYAIVFPILLLSLTVVPIVGMVILASIVIELLVGSPVRVLSFALIFTLGQLLVSVLAVRLQGGDPKLALYAPLFVIGYRQFLDVVMLKSVFDVLFKEDLRWTRAARTGTLHTALEDEVDEDADSVPEIRIEP
ncbi:MAG: glycosyltransferase family 2 protein, partial [Halobacteriales archaeon]|nr:glycosyltransferase family 2 protein [Halobacteriales archaeon]